MVAAIDAATDAAHAAGERLGRTVDIGQMSSYAEEQVSLARDAGATDAVDAFLDSECVGVGRAPVLAEG